MKFVNSSAVRRFASCRLVFHPKGMKSRRAHPGFLFLRTVISLVLLLSLAAQSTFAQEQPDSPETPSAAWNIQTVDAPPYFLNMTNRSLAYRPYDGAPCIAYGGEHLYYSCLVSGVWNTTTIDNSFRVGEYTALAFSSTNRPYIVYYDAFNKKPKFAYYNGVAWQVMFLPDHPILPTTPEEAPTQVEESPTQPEQYSFVDELHKFLQPWLTPLLEPNPEDKSPNFDFDDSYGVGKHTSIDVDRSNNVHITYLDEFEGSLWYVKWNGLDWDYHRVDYYKDLQRVGLWSSIIVDANLGVHISYMSEKYDDLKYAHRKPYGGWDKCTVDGYNDAYNRVGSFSSIALEKDGTPHISYYDFGNGNLKHAWLANDQCRTLSNGEEENGGWKKENVDTGDGDLVGWYSSMAIDGSNVIHISYYNASDSELKYARHDGAWSTKTLHSSGWGSNGLFTSIALSAAGKPGISYYNAEYGILQYTYRSTNAWTTPSNVSYYARDVGLSSSLAVRSNGGIFISYLDASSGNMKFARSMGNLWIPSKMLTSPHAGLFSSIQILYDQWPRVAFYDTDYGNLMYAWWDGWGWYFTYIDRTYDVGQYVSMAFGPSGNPHISYYDATNKNLYYAYWSITANTFYTEPVDTVGSVGMYTSIAVDSAGRPYISYYDSTNNALKVAFKSPIDAWVLRTVDDPDPTNLIDVGWYTSMILKGPYLPYITYYDATNGNLKYAYSTDPNGLIWNIGLVDNSTNDVGRYSSLKWYPTDDSLHVSYYDATGKDLLYARGTGIPITWAVEKVDQTGDIGYFCSLGLDGGGHPAISYYDNSLGDLKIALSPGFVLPAPDYFLSTIRYLPLVHKNP